MKVESVLPRGSIPSIDAPAFASGYFGDQGDEVIVVDGDLPRAYPIRILSYHEIVNDSNDGQPIAVTWCPICWSAAVYDRTVDGRTLTFGMSGKLADDALVMYDRETESEWKQPTGRAIAGPFEGKRLSTLPAPITTWERFVADYPEGVVLQPVRGTDSETGYAPREIYDMQPYERYVDREAFGLYGMRGEGEERTWDREDIDAKTVVLGIEHGGDAAGYPVPVVEADSGVVTDRVGSRSIVVFSSAEGIHAFHDPGFDFEHREGSFEADGTTWNTVTGASGDGRRLERLLGRRLFAFVWQDAHGPNAFYE